MRFRSLRTRVLVRRNFYFPCFLRFNAFFYFLKRRETKEYNRERQAGAEALSPAGREGEA